MSIFIVEIPKISPIFTHLYLSVFLKFLPQDFLAIFFTVNFSMAAQLEVIFQGQVANKIFPTALIVIGFQTPHPCPMMYWSWILLMTKTKSISSSRKI
jgi:hypothetical protein